MSVDSEMSPPDMPVRIQALPAFADNYIWAIRSADGRHAMVVDPGDAAVVMRWLQATGLRLTAILVTHHHPDHAGGVASLREATGATVSGPRHESIPGVDKLAGDGDEIRADGFDEPIRVIDVPGHTAGHIAFVMHIDGNGVLFCGDTLFSAGCGRLFEGSAEELHASLARLAALPGSTRVFCAHEYTAGNLRFAAAVEPSNTDILTMADWARRRRTEGHPTLPSTIAREKRVNPFLRTRVPAVIDAVCTRTGPPVDRDDDIRVFAALRRWKDEFR